MEEREGDGERRWSRGERGKSEGHVTNLLCSVELSLLIVLVSMGAVQLSHIELSAVAHLLQHGDHQTIRHGHVRPIEMLPELPYLQEEARHVDGRGGDPDVPASLDRLVQLDGLLDAAAAASNGQRDPALYQVVVCRVRGRDLQVCVHAVERRVV